MTTERRVGAALGNKVESFVALHGGDLSSVHRAVLADGRTVVAKTGPMADVEARMLNALRAAGAPAPEVLHAEAGLIVLEHLNETQASSIGWQSLGAQLRDLHTRKAGETYGWPEDYAFGPAQIPNTRAEDWPLFWAERRLLAFGASIPADIRKRVEALCGRLPELLPHAPRPALLHGDLWQGNVLFSGDTAFLIDPACYYGDAEVDLAMLGLFGRPPQAFRQAYGPPAPGEAKRRIIYQLWPALVHLRLFGAGYRGLVSGLLDAARA